MPGFITTMVIRAGRSSIENAWTEYRRLTKYPFDKHKPAVNQNLIYEHHPEYIPPEERSEEATA